MSSAPARSVVRGVKRHLLGACTAVPAPCTHAPLRRNVRCARSAPSKHRSGCGRWRRARVSAGVPPQHGGKPGASYGPGAARPHSRAVRG
ncbi:hypothetical protein SNL152K_924 [Streptomyces sp. NL15-2K]|nr:hypothetical protein SNL152K_924 [Streptomyces sp. NL15-2K]